MQQNRSDWKSIGKSRTGSKNRRSSFLQVSRRLSSVPRDKKPPRRPLLRLVFQQKSSKSKTMCKKFLQNSMKKFFQRGTQTHPCNRRETHSIRVEFRLNIYATCKLFSSDSKIRSVGYWHKTVKGKIRILPLLNLSGFVFEEN